jgi:hypothetical protein
MPITEAQALFLQFLMTLRGIQLPGEEALELGSVFGLLMSKIDKPEVAALFTELLGGTQVLICRACEAGDPDYTRYQLRSAIEAVGAATRSVAC